MGEYHSVKMTVCTNCGASFDAALPECPYCNAIYEPAAEKQYMENLEDIKDDLEDLTGVSEDVYKKEIRRNVVRICIFAVAAAVIILAFLGVRYWYYNLYDGGLEMADVKEQILWEQEAFPKLDVWYEEGKYKEIYDYLEEAFNEGYGGSNWEHYYFIQSYIGYEMCMDDRDELTDPDKANVNTTQFVLGQLLYFLYRDDGGLYTEEDWQKLQALRPNLEDILYQDMKFTKEEAEALYEDAMKNGILDYDVIDKYAKKMWKRCIVEE